MADKLFGTDGIRGRANQGIFTPESSLQLGRTIGNVSSRHRLKPVILLGNDGRRSAGLIGNSLISGLLASGLDVLDIGLVTTPGLSYLTKFYKAGMGIMISASHNKASDNGIKIFGPGGAKLQDRVEKEIERTYHRGAKNLNKKIGRTRYASELVEEYLRHLREDAVPNLSLRGFRIVLDCANGGASQIGPALFQALHAEVISIADRPNGDNINFNCGAMHPKVAAHRALKARANIGISLDGDGDRAIFSDELGQTVDGDGVLVILSRDLLRRKRLAKKTMIATVMSNYGLRLAIAKIGAKLSIVGVGDRQVAERLRRGKLSLGGEQSGHIIFGKDNDYIGDGLYTALRLLDVIKRTRSPLSKLIPPFKKYPQVLRNVPVSSKPPFETKPKILEAAQRAELTLKNSGRVLLRYSGTEPVARVMVEGPNQNTISKLAQDIVGAIQRELS